MTRVERRPFPAFKTTSAFSVATPATSAFDSDRGRAEGLKAQPQPHMTITLCCVIKPFSIVNSPFIVTVGDYSRVDEFKDAIKQKLSNALDSVDAPSLTLWKVCQPLLTSPRRPEDVPKFVF